MALNNVFVTKTIQQSLDAPLPQVLSLNAFTTDFSADATAASNIATRYVPGTGTVGTTYNGQAGNTNAVSISMSTPAICSYTFSELNVGQTITPEFLAQTFVGPAINSVAQAITQGVFSLFTTGNFASGIVVPAASNMSTSVFTSGVQILDTLYAFPNDRYIAFNPAYKAGLFNQNVYTQAYSYGNNEAIANGELPPLFGIKPIMYNGGISSSDGNLVGAVWQKNAVAIAARTPVYDASQGYGVVEDFVEPITKLNLQLRLWNDMNGNWRLSVATIYGVAIGANQAARITNS
jgi:hypothetical protein